MLNDNSVCVPFGSVGGGWGDEELTWLEMSHHRRGLVVMEKRVGFHMREGETKNKHIGW